MILLYTAHYTLVVSVLKENFQKKANVVHYVRNHDVEMLSKKTFVADRSILICKLTGLIGYNELLCIKLTPVE